MSVKNTGWTGSNNGTVAKGITGNLSYTTNWQINTCTVNYLDTGGRYYSSTSVNYESGIPYIDYRVAGSGRAYNETPIGSISMPNYNI